MVRFAVGYRSRAFVTFGRPIPVDGYDPSSRKSVLELAHLVRKAIGRLYKVLPTALVASAMRPSIDAARADRPDRLAPRHAARDRRQRRGDERRGGRRGWRAEPFEARGIIVVEDGRFRVRERNVLRYYARSIQHLLSPGGPTH